MSTGARSAIVVLNQTGATGVGSKALPMPPRDEIEAVLSRRLLWLTDDRRAAQWIAYIDVRTPAKAQQPFALTVVDVKKNPEWQPLAISDPLPFRDSAPTSFKLLEANQQNERSMASASR